MKVLVIHAAMPSFDHGLNSVMKTVNDTLSELGLEVEEINLAFADIHYYDGVESKGVDDILEKVQDAVGVIFACSAQMFAPCAAMQTFLEYFDLPAYKQALKNKCCLIVTASKTTGEREAAEYISRVIDSVGGFDILRMPIGAAYQSRIGKDEAIKEMLEKYVEDFYRIVRQNRKFFVSGEVAPVQAPRARNPVASSANMPEAAQDTVDMVSAEQFTKLFGHEPRQKKVTSDDLVRSLNLDSFTDVQEEEIDEITKILSSKYKEETFNRGFVGNLYKNNVTNKGFTDQAVVPRIKTCKQRTQSLEHHYQPQLAGGMEAVFQFHVSGEEAFEGFLSIESTQCVFRDGLSESPDISILVDSKVWTEILAGKFTAQKAFMIGQLKVRGNFVLLTRFDQIFKLGNV